MFACVCVCASAFYACLQFHLLLCWMHRHLDCLKAIGWLCLRAKQCTKTKATYCEREKKRELDWIAGTERIHRKRGKNRWKESCKRKKNQSQRKKERMKIRFEMNRDKKKTNEKKIALKNGKRKSWIEKKNKDLYKTQKNVVFKREKKTLSSNLRGRVSYFKRSQHWHRAHCLAKRNETVNESTKRFSRHIHWHFNLLYVRARVCVFHFECDIASMTRSRQHFGRICTCCRMCNCSLMVVLCARNAI